MRVDNAAAHAVVLGVGGTVSDLNDAELVYGKDDFLNPFFVVRALTTSIPQQKISSATATLS